jgi:hypothetical protein
MRALTSSRAFASSLALAALSLPAQALACPVCSAGRDDAARQAFFDTTIFLSLLPLAMFGGIVYWLMRRARAVESHTQAPELLPTTEE